MKIAEIYIDGFRNIRKTTLNFSLEPIIVLLAPNNCGKSNLLQGIQYGFDLISKQGAQTEKFIKDADNYANWNIKLNPCGTFTFGVKFSINDKRIYNYKYSIDYTNNEIKSEDGKYIFEKSKALAVSMESLSYIDETGKQRILFARKKSNALDIDILPNEICKPVSHVSGESNNFFKFNLVLHTLGNMAAIKNINNGADNNVKTALQDIFEVLNKLTAKNIGDIICDEKSDYLAHGSLSQEVIKLLKMDAEKKTNKFSDFKYGFIELFPYYVVDVFPLQIEGQFQLAFRDNRKDRSEMVKTLSFGTRRVFKLLSQVISNETALISLEEIEIGLHPGLYNGLVRTFFNILENPEATQDNESRLLISSHAPGIVDAFENRLDSVYVSVPDIQDPSCYQFAKLNDEGKKFVCSLIKESGGRAGEYIFDMFASDDRKMMSDYLRYLEMGNLKPDEA